MACIEDVVERSSLKLGLEKTKIFTLKELEKATNNFDPTRIVGHGGHGMVYKGLLSDQRVVAIKKSKIKVQVEIEQFINEVAILSCVEHKKVVWILGCCLESEVPLLVYEFVSNGTLSDHLHVWNRDSYISWGDHLRIAPKVASAVAYLHFDTSKAIFHKDLKSTNILLDEKSTAKVSNFGASKSLMSDQTHITTAAQGTFGYLDPEYFHTGRLTDKSDVYSFGVILVELLTGEKLVSQTQYGEDRNLITHFIWLLTESSFFQVLEGQIVNEAEREELKVVARLAGACLRQRGVDRPTMKEVQSTLEGLKRSKTTSENSQLCETSTNCGGGSQRMQFYMEEPFIPSHVSLHSSVFSNTC